MALLNLCLFKSTHSLNGQNYSPSSTHKTEMSSSSPLLQQTSLAYFWYAIDSYYSRTKRKEETQARICSKQAQQMSISYTTLEQSERKKPKLESQHFPTSSSSPMQPCCKYTAQERSGSYYSRTKQKEETQARICSKRAAPILLSNKAKRRKAKARILPHAALQ